jgi:hypothetical protein
MSAVQSPVFRPEPGKRVSAALALGRSSRAGRIPRLWHSLADSRVGGR